MWLPTRGMEIGLGRMGREFAADRAVDLVELAWARSRPAATTGDSSRPRTLLLQRPRPTYRLAGRTLAIRQRRRAAVHDRRKLRDDRDAPSILAVQGVAWLGIDATGKRRGTLAATP